MGDWKCCGQNIQFLNDIKDKNKIKEDKKTKTTNYIKNNSNDGLDAFLSDVLEETYHKKRNEAILLSMQRQNKSHIIDTQNTKKAHKSSTTKTSFFSSSHHSKLCQRCCHI